MEQHHRAIPLGQGFLHDRVFHPTRRSGGIPVVGSDVPMDVPIPEGIQPRQDPGIVGTFSERAAEPRPRVDPHDFDQGTLGAADASYAFQVGKFFNLESSDFIKGHSDVTGKEVAHAVRRAIAG